MKKKINPYDELFNIYFADGNVIDKYLSKHRDDYNDFIFMFGVPYHLMPEYLTMPPIKGDEIIGMCILFAREIWRDQNN